jgi:hypothetical protein
VRIAAVVILLVFAITLAVVVGTRLSTDALAVVVGVACGAAAGMPMSVLLLAALNRSADASPSRATSPRLAESGFYPPVVVIQGGHAAGSGPLPPYYPSAVEAAPRRFRIVGEDEP